MASFLMSPEALTQILLRTLPDLLHGMVTAIQFSINSEVVI